VGRIILASDGNQKHLFQHAYDSVVGLGYDPIVYDLGGLGIGKEHKVSNSDLKKDGFIPCLFKIEVIQRSILDGFMELAWLDSDCVLKHRIDEVWEDEYDIGVTPRPDWEYEQYPNSGRINSGVLFLKGNKYLWEFLLGWKTLAHQINSEQMALNRLLESEIVQELKIKEFPSLVYNSYHSTSQAKIVHYKGMYRKQHPASL
jgi:hypothetical protein